MRNKFNLGDKVLHRSQNKTGTVTLVFADDKGLSMYYVDHSGFRWSAPEKAFLRLTKSSTYKSENATNAPGASKSSNHIQTDQEA